MFIIPSNNSRKNDISSSIDLFFKRFNVSAIAKKSNTQKSKGFRFLQLGWGDGNSFLPVSFTLLSSSKKVQAVKKMDICTTKLIQ